jgi:DNA-binding CsgD family transcriptional regulator
VWLVNINTVKGNLPFRLDRGEFIVGRIKRAQIVIAERTVSRKHARLTYDGKELAVEDLGSSNGTFVNEERIVRRELQAGQHVRFGSVACAISTTPLFPGAMQDEESTYQIASPQASDETALMNVFTTAQLRIIPLLMKGLSESEIAQRFERSPHTIHAHIRAIFEKVGVHSREELIVRLMNRE